MNNFAEISVTAFVLVFMYILMFFTQKLSSQRQFYGVSLNSDYFKCEEFKSLDKKFKLLLTVGFVIFMIISFVAVCLFENFIIYYAISIIGFLLYQFVVFVHIHNKVKELKKELSLEVEDLELKKTNIILDTDFINKKNKVISKYSILFLIPMVINILVCIYVITQYNLMPDMIPTHWGFNGEIDAYSQKSFISVFGIVFVNIVIATIVYISSVGSLKSRAKLNIDSLEESKKSHLTYLNKYGITFFILNLSLATVFIVTLISTVNVSNINPFIMIFTTVLLIISASYLTYLYFKSPGNSKNSAYSVDDSDDKWLLGTIYNNPQDPSLFVQKRFGVGWTINIGNTKGKLFLIFTFVLIFAIIFIAYNI